MKSKQIIKLTLLCLVFNSILSCYSFSIPQTISKNNIAGEIRGDTPNLSLTPHSPIYIVGNGDLTEANGVLNESVSGTKDNPYIIENYTITSGGSTGIYLRDTTVHVFIRNCKISGSSTYGIHIYNGINVTVQNNSITDYSYGIRLYNSTTSTVKLNFCDDQSMAGIQLDNSNKIFVQGNEVVNSWDSGITIKNTQNSTIVNNSNHHNDYAGLELDGASYCLIKENENMYQSAGILIRNTEFANITLNYNHHNKYYGLQFSSNNGNNSVFNNSFVKNYKNGLYLYQNQDNEIFDNDLSLNGEGPFSYSQSYSDNLYNNILNQPNEMSVSNLPTIDSTDKTKSYTKIFTLSVFDAGSAGDHKLSFQFSCEKSTSNSLTIILVS